MATGETPQEQLLDENETVEHEFLLPEGQTEEQVKEEPPKEEPPTEEEGSGETAEEAAERQLIEWVDQKYGRGYSQKYKTDLELINGLVNAEMAIGRYNEDKQLGEMVRQNPQQALKVLQERLQQAEQPKEQPAPQEDPLAGFNPFMVPAENAPEDVKQRFAEQQRLLQQRLVEQAVNPGKYAPAQPGIDPQQVQQLVQQQVQQQAYVQQVQHDMKEWIGKHAGWLFVNGDIKSGQLTPLAMELSQEDQRLQQGGMMDPMQRIEVAMNIMRGRHAQAAAGPKPPANDAAKQKSDRAAVPPPQPGQILEGESLGDSLRRELGVRGTTA